MALYTNHSRHSAIVTVQIQSTQNPNGSLERGVKDSFVKLTADVGYHDFVIEPEQQLKLGENSTALLIAVRANV